MLFFNILKVLTACILKRKKKLLLSHLGRKMNRVPFSRWLCFSDLPWPSARFIWWFIFNNSYSICSDILIKIRPLPHLDDKKARVSVKTSFSVPQCTWGPFLITEFLQKNFRQLINNTSLQNQITLNIKINAGFFFNPKGEVDTSSVVTASSYFGSFKICTTFFKNKLKYKEIHFDQLQMHW